NFQHGNMNPIASFYLFQFDLYFIWNEISKKVLLKDGYSNPSGLEIVGSPFLDNMVIEKNNYVPRVLFQELQEWKGNDKLITAYSTFQATHLTIQNKIQFMESLIHFLKQRPHLKLLIKKHPYELDDSIATYLEAQYEASPALRNQIRLFNASEISLLESLLLSNLVTSICSTVLQEALYLKIPAVALDFENIHELIGLEERFVYPVVTDPSRVKEKLNQYLTEDDSLNSFPGFKPERFELLFPTFTKTYEERIQSVLQKYKFSRQNPAEVSTQT
ncbi:MAG: hypothetical protein K2X66_07200, partial [Cyanobacteria bacterium]|nr:hypothetical protein [Cyanobacteriota bacterium]